MPIYRRGSLDPFTALRTMQREMERLMGMPGLAREAQRVGGGTFPPINVYSGENDVVVMAEVPGLHSKDLDLSITGETLVIKGTKSFTPDEEKVRFHRRERGAGEFTRTVMLPERVDADRINARLSNGILRITLPKSESAKPKQIQVQS